MKHQLAIIILISTCIIAFVLKADWWWFLIILMTWLFITFLGVVNMDFHYFLKSYIRNPTTKERKIAITLDDGPTEFTPNFLELLEKFNQKATFFCIGKRIEEHSEIFKKIVENGHEIGNHSYSHSNKIGLLSTKKMTEEIMKTDETILKFGGISTNLYRPPFGIINPNIAKAIKKTGKHSIGWNIRSFDTAITDEQQILNRILPKIKPGSVILLHDTSEKSLRVLEQILLLLHRENYESITISQLFNLKE